MSLLNGLAAAGESIARTAGMMSLEAMRSSLEEDRAKLAREFAEGAASRGRAEAHDYDMKKEASRQDFERPGRDAQTRSLTATATATEAQEGRIQAGIKAAGGGTAGTGATTEDQKKFFETIRPWAEEASRKTGVKAEVIMAQAALESAYGKAAPGNNYFGIKSHDQPGGQTLDTTEVGPDGKPVKTKASFRTYNSPAESFEGYARFINENGRYEKMRGAKDLETQIAELGRSGYATDPQYAPKVASIARSLGEGLPTGGVSEMPAGMRESREALRQAGKLTEMAALDAQWAQDQNKRGMPTAGERERARMGHEPPKEVQVYEWLRGQTPEAQKQFLDMINEKKDNVETKVQDGQIININKRTGQQIGKAVKIEGFDAPMNNEQSRDAGFADRMTNSNAILSTIDKQGTDMWARFLDARPGGNLAQSEEFQKFSQAKLDFINSQLRRESGAVISKEELEKADKQYFPQPGDTPAVIEQKAINRRISLNAMVRSAGPGYKPPDPLEVGQAPGTENDASGFGPGGGPQGAAGTPRITDEAGWNALRPGTLYIAPDGKMRTKR